MPATSIRPVAAFLLAATLAVGFAGCDRDERSPAEKIEEGRELVKEGSAEIQEDVEEASSTAEKLAGDAKDLGQQQINLIKSQLADFDERISKLPAEQERAFSARLTELKARANDAESAVRGYAGQAGAAWEPVQEKLSNVKVDVRRLRRGPARSEAMTPQWLSRSGRREASCSSTTALPRCCVT